jgi:ketosteroid isomerase-like protein
MGETAGSEEAMDLLEVNGRVGAAMRDILLGVTGAGSALDLFAADAMIHRIYTGQTTPVRPAPGAERPDGERPPPRPAGVRREHVVVHPSVDGFALEELLTRDLPDGTRVEASLCMVCTIEGGLITHVVEYADAAQMHEVTGV